jgi:PAS domain S-box-containing protein
VKEVPQKLAGEAKQEAGGAPSNGAETAATRTRDALYEQIIQSAKDAVIAIDERQNIVLFNPAAELIFLCSAEEVTGKPLERFIPKRVRAVHDKHLAEYAKRHDAVRVMGSDRVVMGLRADGEEFPLDATISQIDLGGERRYVVVLRDVTERVRMQRELRLSLENQKRAEAELRESRDSLRELSAALQSIREEEKTRIARELHDELGQALTALKMDASAIAGDLAPEQTELAKRARGMKQLIDQTMASVRRISADMRPVMLDNLGLAPTLEWLTRDIAVRADIPIELFMPDEDLGASGDAATAIFRIVQEALTNVVRHANATCVRVEVTRAGGDVRVRVIDDGRGISDADQRKARSFGLLGMRERAYVLGGAFSIRGQNDKSGKSTAGTTVEATIPAFGTVRGRAS